MPKRPVSTIPSTDRAFQRAVEKVVDDGHDATLDQIAARLRGLFPKVAVFRRLVSGESGHLYAYRDGHYEKKVAERWWDGPGVACVRVDAASGELTYISKEWAELMSAEPLGLLHRHFTDFVLPEATAAAQGMFEAVIEGGEVDTEALLLRPDHSTITIELHASRDDGEVDIRYRLKP